MGSSRQKRGLAHGRPGLRVAEPSKARFKSAKTGRAIIRKHHQLIRALGKAEKAEDAKQVADIRKQLDELGGLASYQHASLLGQSRERGGDSSKVLVEWMKARSGEGGKVLRVLEVGALSANNACSKWKGMAVTRIDLHSQSPDISQQDFMQRPLPATDEDRFDVISLSLVINYVADRTQRGEMLARTRQFLCLEHEEGMPSGGFLFLVLPAPCILNSRYMTSGHLVTIMSQVGYDQVEAKATSRLHYSLWRNTTREVCRDALSRKEEINPGKQRNNFAILASQSA